MFPYYKHIDDKTLSSSYDALLNIEVASTQANNNVLLGRRMISYQTDGQIIDTGPSYSGRGGGRDP